MQIIIDIPEDVYRNILEIPASSMFAIDCDEDIRKGIQNGIVLPKGHGRLIDADKLEPRDISPESWYSPMWGFELDDIEDAPTIIEADKPTYGCSSCPHSGSIIDGYVDCPDAYTKQSQYCGLNNKEG